MNPKVGSMLAKRRRRLANIEPILGYSTALQAIGLILSRQNISERIFRVDQNSDFAQVYRTLILKYEKG